MSSLNNPVLTVVEDNSTYITFNLLFSWEKPDVIIGNNEADIQYNITRNKTFITRKDKSYHLKKDKTNLTIFNVSYSGSNTNFIFMKEIVSALETFTVTAEINGIQSEQTSLIQYKILDCKKIVSL